jgi:hypothetical protein
MAPGSILDLKTYVPAKNHVLAKPLYGDLGQARMGQFADGRDWDSIEAVELKKKYPGIIAKSPALQQWGFARFVSD